MCRPSAFRRIDHIWEARSSSSAAGQGSGGGPRTVRSEAAVRRASSGSAPARAARSIAVCSTSASSTAIQARPRAAARSPSTRSPKSAIAAAASRAPVRPSSALWPPPGCSPIGMKPEMIFASRATMRTSVASIRLSPAPTAPPRTAATGGRLELADTGEGAIDRPEPRVYLGVRRIAPGRLERAAIAAGAEEPSLAAHHHGAHASVTVELLAGGHELLGHGGRERVAPVWRVEAEHRDAALAPLDRDLRRHPGRDATYAAAAGSRSGRPRW